MSEEKNERRVPKLRFKGFTDDWMQYPLDEITDVYDGTHQTPNYTDSGIKFLSVENISNLETTKYISEEDFKKDFKIYPTFGDVLMTRIGSIGVTNIVEKDELLAYYVSLALLKPHNDNGLFIKYLIDSSKVQKELWRRTLHIAFPKKINKNEIGKVKVNIPLNDEQDKISNLLKKIDSLIALEQEKLKLIKSLKTFLLDSLYTNKTSSPLLRFQKFSESWKEIKLKKISNITMGQSPKSKNYTDNPNDKILVQGNTDLKNNLVSPRVWTTQITKVASKGDIILTVRAPVGEVAVSQYDVVLGRGVASLSGNYFVFQLLLQMKEKNYWRKYSTGSTFESINSDDIKNAKVKIPSIEEQEKIGGLLHSIDKILILEQEKLKKYNCVKQLLLNSLFI